MHWLSGNKAVRLHRSSQDLEAGMCFLPGLSLSPFSSLNSWASDSASVNDGSAEGDLISPIRSKSIISISVGVCRIVKCRWTKGVSLHGREDSGEHGTIMIVSRGDKSSRVSVHKSTITKELWSLLCTAS